MPASALATAVRRRLPVLALIFAVAFGLRLGVVCASRGGLTGIAGYDPGVYYAAADALLSGRLPYADFVLLHPPAMMLALAPFAALGRLTTDHTGFVVATVAFTALGATNAVLVSVVARRLGLSGVAAALGGLFYGIWFGAIDAEAAVRLEPLSSFAFLCGLLLLADGRRPDRRPDRRRTVLAGAALGAACTVKIWWVVPLAVVLVWNVRRADTRRSARDIGLGAVAAGALIAGPFFALAPASMWHMVITDQLGRNAVAPLQARLSSLTTLSWAFPRLAGGLLYVALGVLAALFVTACVAAWQVPRCRMIVAVAVAQVFLLLSAPSYFPFYDGFPAAALALVVAGAAAARVPRVAPSRRPGPVVAGAAVLAVATLTAVTVLLRPDGYLAPFPGRQLAARVAHFRCVMADSPIALIEMNALTSDLVHGCPNWVDVTGRTYGPDAAAGVPRRDNRRWQADLRRYLLDGNALIVIRSATGYSAATIHAIDREPVLDRVQGYVVRAGRQ